MYRHVGQIIMIVKRLHKSQTMLTVEQIFLTSELQGLSRHASIDWSILQYVECLEHETVCVSLFIVLRI